MSQDHPWDAVVDLMKDSQIPLTRENYLKVAYAGHLPEWTPEAEEDLPPSIRDWTLHSFGSHGGIGRSQQPHAASSTKKRGYLHLTDAQFEDDLKHN